jgi:CBS domain-containing membrane protein
MTKSTGELYVRDLMAQPVHTLRATQSLPLAESMMGLLHVRHVPVIDDEHHVVGLVTHRDLLAAKISALAPLSDDERSSLQLLVPVSRVMRTEVWTVEPGALAINAARIMREHRIGCLPVIDGGKLVGILTEADLLALVTDALALERPARPWTMERAMTPIPVTIGSDTTIGDARAAMTRYGIRHLPVVHDGRPVAMVSERDLGIAETIFKETNKTSAVHVARLIGSGHVHRVELGAHVDHVLHDMFRDREDAVLVVDQDRVVGIFTALHACRVLAATMPAAR